MNSLVILLVCYCVVRELMWVRERRELTDRIQCRDLAANKAGVGKKKPGKPHEAAAGRAVRQWREKYRA